MAGVNHAVFATLARHAKPSIGYGVVVFDFETIDAMSAAVKDLKDEMGEWIGSWPSLVIHRAERYIQLFD